MNAKKTHLRAREFETDSEFDIIRGAENDDYAEVNAALAENPFSIIFQDPATGLTALHVAAGDGNLEMTKHLLDQRHKNPRLKDAFGRDPLDLAIEIGHLGVIEELFEAMFPRSAALKLEI